MNVKRTMAILSILLGALFCQDAHAFYNPSSGRWLNRDTIGEEGGANLYELGRNNTQSYVDKRGQDLWKNSPVEEEFSNVSFPSAKAGWLRRPVRPSNRDEPQRDRCGRRESRCRCSGQPGAKTGDPNCDRCGPEVASALTATLSGVKARFDVLSDDDKKKVCSLGHLAGTWDINFPKAPKGCAEGPCSETVMVSGKCYDLWKVNYLLFGYISKLCDFSRIKMEAIIAAQKLVRKPCIDGDFEYEYTGDVKGFARIGFKWDGSLPSELPGPTGGFSGCKPCDKPGADDPKYKSAFGTTWP